jgi:hypothetical protein
LAYSDLLSSNGAEGMMKSAADQPVEFLPAPDHCGWVVLHTGLLICVVSLLFQTVAALLACICWAGTVREEEILKALARGHIASLYAIGFVWGVFGWMISTVALIVGWLVCLRVPADSIARSLIRAAVGCLAAVVAMALVSLIINLGLQPAAGEAWTVLDALTRWVLAPVGFGGIMAFAIFLARLSEHLGNGQGWTYALVFVILLGIATVTFLPGETIAPAGPARPPAGMAEAFRTLKAFLAPVIVLVTHIAYVCLAYNAYRLVGSRCGPSARD